jgi:hypothetical protein
MALAALIVGPIALEKANDANDDVNGDSETFTSELIQAGVKLMSDNITISFKSVGDMNYATFSTYRSSNVNSSLSGTFRSAITIPSVFIPKTSSGNHTNTPYSAMFYSQLVSPPSSVGQTGNWQINSNGTVVLALGASNVNMLIGASTLAYPKIID